MLIFSKNFILVRIVVDPEAIPGTLDVRWEHTLDGTQFGVFKLSTSMCSGGERKRENLKETHSGKHVELGTDINLTSDSNQQPWS